MLEKKEDAMNIHTKLVDEVNELRATVARLTEENAQLEREKASLIKQIRRMAERFDSIRKAVEGSE